jgi:hypothetical protein
MSQNLILGGDCPVPPGTVVFVRDVRSGSVFPICPDCGFAWPDYPKQPMLITDYLPTRFACPDGFVVVTRAEVEAAGFRDLISGAIPESDFAWDLGSISRPDDVA